MSYKFWRLGGKGADRFDLVKITFLAYGLLWLHMMEGGVSQSQKERQREGGECSCLY